MILPFSKYIPVMFTMSLFFIACKKSGSSPEINYTILKVLGFKTNTPIADANVVLEKCTHPDPFGCLESSVVGTLRTYKDGNFKFDSKLGVYLIGASHMGYWSNNSGGNSSGLDNVYLTPVAYPKSVLKK